MQVRGRKYTRSQRNRAINRKFNILRGLWGTKEAEDVYCLNRKGKLSKGKIHCSCWLCREKSYIELAKVDKLKLLADVQALKEYYGEY